MPPWVEWLKTGLMFAAAAFGALKAIDTWRRHQFKAEYTLTVRLESLEQKANDSDEKHEMWRVAMSDLTHRTGEIERRIGEKDRRHTARTIE